MSFTRFLLPLLLLCLCLGTSSASAQYGAVDQARELPGASPGAGTPVPPAPTPGPGAPVVPTPDASANCGSPDEPGYSACVQSGQAGQVGGLKAQIEEEQARARAVNQAEQEGIKVGLILPAAFALLLLLGGFVFLRNRR